MNPFIKYLTAIMLYMLVVVAFGYMCIVLSMPFLLVNLNWLMFLANLVISMGILALALAGSMAFHVKQFRKRS